MKRDTKGVGEQTEAVILSRFLQHDYSVSVPFGNNQRYDMIVDDGERLYKVQCKTARKRGACVRFSVRSINCMTYVSRTYKNQIDFFAAYCPETDDVYIIPIEKTGRSNVKLRIDPVVNRGRQKTIRWAKESVLKRGTLAERWSHKPVAAGSTPALATI